MALFTGIVNLDDIALSADDDLYPPTPHAQLYPARQLRVSTAGSPLTDFSEISNGKGKCWG